MGADFGHVIEKKNRRVTLRADARLPANYHTAERLYLTDDKGRTFMEVTGQTVFKGRKQKMLTKNEWKQKGYELIGGLRRGTNRIVTFMHNDMLVVQVQGGLHKVNFEIEDESRFFCDFARAYGYHVYRHKQGGWKIYVPVRRRHRR